MKILTPQPVINLTDQLDTLNLSDHSNYVTADHLQELGYPRDHLISHAKIINAEIQECWRRKLPSYIRKAPHSTPFTFYIDPCDPSTTKITIIFPKTLAGACLHKSTCTKIKKSICILISDRSNPLSTTVSKTVACRYQASAQYFKYENQIWLQKLAKKVLIPIPHFISSYPRYQVEFDRYDGNLFTAYNKKRISLSQSLAALSTIGKLLQRLHDDGIVHHNIKPNNILFNYSSDSQIEPHLQDYRLSKQTDTHCSPGHYLFWDHLARNGIASSNSDVYGLTASAFIMLIQDFLTIEDPEKYLWFRTVEGRAKILCYALLNDFTDVSSFLDSAPKTNAEVFNCIDAAIARKQALGESTDSLQALRIKTKAQADIISIMAREEKNSLELLHQVTNHEDKPTLTTAASLAEELHKIHLDLSVAKDLHETPILAGRLIRDLPQSALPESASRLQDAVKRQLLEGSTERRISKTTQPTGFTFATRSIDAHRVHVQVIYPKTIPDAVLGEGGFKRVKKSRSFTFTFSPGNTVDIHWKSTALHRFKLSKDYNYIQRSLSIHEKLASKVPPGTKIVPPSHIRKYTSKHGQPRIEMESDRYDQDLNTAVKNKKITISDSIRILSEIGDTLQAIHDAGFVHKDIKTDNILLKKQGKNCAFVGFLNDFDLTKETGYKSNENNYIIWDECANAGMALPNTDVYGLTLAAFEILISNFTANKAKNLLASGDTPASLLYKVLKASTHLGLKIDKTQGLSELLDAAKQYSIANTVTAQARIIQIFAREISNSQKFFEYYTQNKDQEAMPSLTSAQTLASELREIHALMAS